MRKNLLLLAALLIVILLASCESPVYTVRLELPDGTLYNETEVEESDLYRLPEVESETGYSFEGWFFDDRFVYPVPNEITVEQDLLLYGKYLPIGYTITYVGFDGAEETESVSYGDTITLMDAIEETGYEFDGWYYDEDYLSPIGTELTVETDITVYGLYTPIDYTLTLQGLNGVYEVATYNYGDTVVFPEPHIIDGNAFVGVSTTEYASIELDTFVMPAEDTVLYMAYTQVTDIALSLYYLPARSIDEMMDAMELFGPVFKDIMIYYGYHITDLEQSVASSYESAYDALITGQTDLSVLTGQQYAQAIAEENATVKALFTSTRNVLMVDSDDPVDWNNSAPLTVEDEILKPYYYSLILAGPSTSGTALSAKVNNGDTLVWDDVKNLNWCVRSEVSTSGYLFANLWLTEQFGYTFTDITGQVITTSGYGHSMEMLAAETCDVGVFYSGVRVHMEQDWEGFGRTESIWTEVQVVGVTQKIMLDVIAYNTDNIDEDLAYAISETILRLIEEETIQEWLDMYGWITFETVSDEDYLPYQELYE